MPGQVGGHGGGAAEEGDLRRPEVRCFWSKRMQLTQLAGAYRLLISLAEPFAARGQPHAEALARGLHPRRRRPARSSGR